MERTGVSYNETIDAGIEAIFKHLTRITKITETNLRKLYESAMQKLQSMTPESKFVMGGTALTILASMIFLTGLISKHVTSLFLTS